VSQPAAPRRPSWRLPVAALAWNVCLGLSTLLVPLHARDAGLSAAAIGGLFGLPVLAQLVFLLLGGAYADRIGGKKVMLASCILFALCAGSLLLGAGMGAIVAGQLLLVIARSVFWPAMWSLNAQAGLDDGRAVGRLNAFVNLGQLAGTVAAGLLAAAWGVASGFVVMIVCAGAGALLVQTVPVPRGTPGAGPASTAGLASTYLRLLRLPAVHYANLCSFVSAVPLTLGSSFIPLLLVERGLGFEAAGVALSMRAVGAVLAGFAVVHLIAGVSSRFASSAMAVVTGACLLALSAVQGPIGAGSLIFALGFMAASMNAYFLLLLPRFGPDEKRGSLIAIGSVGVMVSHICIPVLTGYLTGLWGIQRAFAASAGVAFACAVALPLLQRRAFR
jgi:MFS family permease